MNVYEKNLLLFFFVIITFILSCSSVKNNSTNQIQPYSPESKSLHDSIVYMDSLLFEAYNTCKPDQFGNLISNDIEFYHDRGGLTTF